MSFTDVIKKSVLEGFANSTLSTGAIVAALGMAALFGLYIYVIYRTTTRSGFYNRGFNKSLAAMPVITTGILLAMQSNFVVSLGMVGALSIVRFRNAVKDSMDLTFLFWSISLGIVIGTGLYELAVLLSLCVTVLVFALDLLPAFREPCLLVVSGTKEADEKALVSAAGEYGSRVKIRSRNASSRGMEWIVELQAKNGAELVRRVSGLEGITSVNLLSHDGEVRY